jgi:V8-like Glu-specific endopeptidase
MRHLALAVIALVTCALPATAVAQPHARAAHRATAVATSWTPERMAVARPLDLVRGAHGRMHLRRAHPVQFGSAEQSDPTPYPNSTNGRLFGRLKGIGDYSCSATVVDTHNGRVVLTAGHCVFEPRLGRFATDLVFVPAYHDMQAPYGVWAWQSAATTRQWAFKGNTNYDYATVKLRKLNATPIETVVGARRMKTNIVRNQGYGVFGYPVNLGGGERLWGCLSPYAGKDPHPFRDGKAPSAIGCDMTAGASGGGWVNANGNLVSVTSFGYEARPNVIFGPYLTVVARNLVSRAGR